MPSLNLISPVVGFPTFAVGGGPSPSGTALRTRSTWEDRGAPQGWVRVSTANVFQKFPFGEDVEPDR